MLGIIDSGGAVGTGVSTLENEFNCIGSQETWGVSPDLGI